MAIPAQRETLYSLPILRLSTGFSDSLYSLPILPIQDPTYIGLGALLNASVGPYRPPDAARSL